MCTDREIHSVSSVENTHIAMYVLIHSYNNDKLFVFFLFLGCDICMEEFTDFFFQFQY